MMVLITQCDSTSHQDNPRENFRIALETADKHLDVPPMLDAEGAIYIMHGYVF